MNEHSSIFVLITLGVFALTALAEWILIPILRSHKAGQRILDIGPRWHKSKEGTPTMGGLSFLAAFTARKAPSREEMDEIKKLLDSFGVM